MSIVDKTRFTIGFNAAYRLKQGDFEEKHRKMTNKVGEMANQSIPYASGFRHGLVARNISEARR